MRRFDLFLGSASVFAGITLSLLIEHRTGSLEASVSTFVLSIGVAGILLLFRRRTAQQQSEPVIATLFGGESLLPLAPERVSETEPGADFRASQSTDTLAPVLEMPAPVVAELQIEYSHNECDSPRLRSKPILLKNTAPGSDACKVRIRPLRAPQKTLIFKPEVINRLSGDDAIELEPQYEQRAGELPRPSASLPDFIGAFYNPSGLTDLKALNEIYEEKSLILEIEYESAGKEIVAECELLYTQWHKNIRMGRQEIRVLSPVQSRV